MHLAVGRPLAEHGGHACAQGVALVLAALPFDGARVRSAVRTTMAHYQRWSRRACSDGAILARGQSGHWPFRGSRVGTALGSTGRTTEDYSGGAARHCSEGAVGAVAASCGVVVARLPC